MTIKLINSLQAWSSPAFNDIVKQEIEELDVEMLPLQQGLSQSSVAKDDKVTAIIITTSEQADCIQVKAGVFYTGLIPGCSCADDPTPESEYTEHCELLFEINKQSADTTVTLLQE